MYFEKGPDGLLYQVTEDKAVGRRKNSVSFQQVFVLFTPEEEIEQDRIDQEIADKLAAEHAAQLEVARAKEEADVKAKQDEADKLQALQDKLDMLMASLKVSA